MPDITISKDDPLRIFVAGDPEPKAGFYVGAAEGQQYVTLYVHNGDIAGHRNEQGGSIGTGQGDDINLDIAAGNGETPGWVNFTPDVGKGVRFMDAQEHEMARFRTAAGGATPLITLTAPTHIKTLFVPNGKGGWRRAAV